MAERRLTPLPNDQRGSRRWTPPTLAASGSPAVLRAPVRSTIFVVLIGLLAAALIYSLQLVVARNQRIQVRLAELEGDVNLLNAREWEARTGVISSEHKNDIPVSQERLRNILSELRQWTGQAAPVLTAPGAAPGGPPPTRLQQVEIDVSRYLTAVAKFAPDEIASLDAGRVIAKTQDSEQRRCERHGNTQTIFRIACVMSSNDNPTTSRSRRSPSPLVPDMAGT